MAQPNTGPLPNRPGEAEFQLKMTPECVVFSCANGKPVWCDILITNPGTQKESFKVKCTSAEIFRVQPPIGVIPVGETAKVRIWFQNKSIPDQNKQRHYFAVYHLKCDSAVTAETAKNVWTKTARPDGVRRLMVVFDKTTSQQPSAAPPQSVLAPAPGGASASVAPPVPSPGNAAPPVK